MDPEFEQPLPSDQENSNFQPEPTEKIIEDLTVKPEKGQRSLSGFLRSNALKLSPLLLLASAAAVKAGYFPTGTESNSEISLDAQKAVAAWQLDAGKRIDNYEHDARGDFDEHGQVVLRDKEGKIIVDGFIDVKDYPADEYPDGTKTHVIGSLPAGTQVDRIVERGKLDDKDNKEGVATFRCEAVKGNFVDPQTHEKQINLPDGTICVIPWVNVHATK